MIKLAGLSFFVVLGLFPFLFPFTAAQHQQAGAGVSILNRSGNAISELTDGDSIQFSVRLANVAAQPTLIQFRLDPDDEPVAECTVASGGDMCQTDVFRALGWFWARNGRPSAHRILRAGSASAAVQVLPRPVVLVHGFGSSAEAWSTYVGDKGFLASVGIRGFAVGDGQVPGRLELGSLVNPTAKTGTLLSNAETLRDYVAAVKRLTGAQMVDLVAHSMGNLVSRYYIDRVMAERDIAQMIMLGPPNAGTDCASLPSALGYYLPAALEIRPSYVQNVFNAEVIHRHGVPFTIIAGTPIVEQIQSPCTTVPSDLAIALACASAIPAAVQQTDAWHSDLNTSRRVFDEHVRPLLERTAGTFTAEPDPAASTPEDKDLQFTRVFTGHVGLRNSATETINLDSVSVASFALFDPTRSLTVTVRGATGNVIGLDPVRNGLIVVQDPATLVYLGYGFNNPRPGPWRVTLATTDVTPPGGADYAITAQLVGGALLKTQASPLLPKVGESVRLSARLELGGQALEISDAQVGIRAADGSFETIALAGSGGEREANWTPNVPGVHGLDVTAHATAPDGTLVERSVFLSVEAQPSPEQFLLSQVAVALGACLGVLAVGLAAWKAVRDRRVHGR